MRHPLFGLRPTDRVAFVFHGMLKSPTQAPAAEGEESGPLVEIEEVSILFVLEEGSRLGAAFSFGSKAAIATLA